MKLIVITSGKKSEDELLAVIKMLEAGLDILHIRKPHFSTHELAEYIRAIPAHFHNRLVIHSHHNLASKFDLRGVHFTQIHLDQKFHFWWTRRMLGIKKPLLTKSLSYHRLTDVYRKERIQPDYCLVGTMFQNITGGLYSGFYEETVMAANRKSGRRLIARGGVNEKSVELAHRLGFYGVALYGYLWKSKEPLSRYLNFVKYCKEKNIPID